MTNEAVDFIEPYNNIWSEEDFPLTPVEAWYVMRGYAVKPKKPVDVDQMLKMPGKLEMSNGYIMLWES